MQREVDSAVSIPDVELHEVIRQLLFEEKRLLEEERREPREPFFRPVSIAVDGGVSNIAGFSRDISNQGIGLTHRCHIPLGKVFVEVPVSVGRPRLFRVEILWCNRITREWYTSGGRILERLPSLPAPKKLLPNEEL